MGAAIRRAKAEKKKVTIEGLRVETNGSGQTINLIVTPFDKPDVMRGLMMSCLRMWLRPQRRQGLPVENQD